MPPDDGRCDRSPVVQWVGWHLAEIAGVVVPLVLAVTVAAWIALAALLVAGCWAGHEIRVHRRRRSLTAATRPSVTTGPAGSADTETLTRKETSA